MHVKTLRFLCTRNAFVPCTYVKWRYETHSLDADDIPHGSLFQKRIIVCHLAQKKYTFCQYSGRGSFSHFTPNLHEVGTWLYALIPRTSTSISFTLFIILHPALCIRPLLNRTALIIISWERLYRDSGVAFVDRQASCSCPDTKHAQTGSRRHAGGLPQSCA